MKKLIVILPLVAALSGCASKESLAALEAARAQLQALQVQVESERTANGQASQSLIAAVHDAETRLIAAREEVKRSKVESVSAPAAQVAEGAAPYANAFFPGAGALLVALSSFLGKLGKKNGAA